LPELELRSYSADITDPNPNVLEINLQTLQNNGDIKPHPTADVVVLPIFDEQKKPDGSGTTNNTSVPGVTIKALDKNGSLARADLGLVYKFDQVLVGNDVLVYGYPTSVGIPNQPQFESDRPLLRKGIVAGRNLQTRGIILDCPAYQGNSGGPVIQIEDVNLGQKQFRIIGVISQFVPFLDIWYNLREKYTNTTELNSGYSVAVPMDFVLELTQSQ
jgi:hypothetical protein